MKIKDKKIGQIFDDIEAFKSKFYKDWGIKPTIRIDLDVLFENLDKED